MNLIDLTVVEVYGEPEAHTFSLGTYWSVDVKVTAYGRESESTLTFNSLEEAQAVKVGYTYQG